MRTKADILFELQEFDLSIRAYKKLKDMFLFEDKLRMKSMEQISVCYATCGYHNVAITYLKKAL